MAVRVDLEVDLAAILRVVAVDIEGIRRRATLRTPPLLLTLLFTVPLPPRAPFWPMTTVIALTVESPVRFTTPEPVLLLPAPSLPMPSRLPALSVDPPATVTVPVRGPRTGGEK